MHAVILISGLVLSASDGCTLAADSVRALPSGPGAAPAWAGAAVPEPIWRMAEAALAAPSGDARLCLLRVAEADARTMLEADTSDVAARYAVAAVLGLRADREEGRDQLRVASALYGELERILAADPEHARARHALGRLQAGVMRMGGLKRWVATRVLDGAILSDASWEAAEANLAFAERVLPDVPDHHYELAHLYGDTGRPELAVEEILHVLGREPRSAMERDTHRKAVALFERLGD